MREAKRISRDLLTRRLVACVNMYPVVSTYSWKRKIVVDREVLMSMKTRSELFTLLKKRILALHTYEVPDIIAFNITKGHDRYLQWVDDCVMRDRSESDG